MERIAVSDGAPLLRLTQGVGRLYFFGMNATLSADGQIILPPELRASAQLQPGDTLEVQFHKGTIILRKHQPLTPEQCALLLERSRSQPTPTLEDEAAVEQAIREVRTWR